MAKNFKSSLPKVISKANRDISNIIDHDIAKESALLKDLVDQVLKANLEVKKKNNQRITETKRKLAELDEQIDDLNVKIDFVDRETIIQQLNEMIDAENKIFNARQEIRFFDNEQLPERINTLDLIYQDLVTSLKNQNSDEEKYRTILLNSNSLLMDKQLEVTNEITSQMNETFTRKQDIIKESLLKLDEFKYELSQKEIHLNEQYTSQINEYYRLLQDSTTTFTDINNDEQLNEQLNQQHIDNLENLVIEKETILRDFEANKEAIYNEFTEYESSVKGNFESSNKIVLDAEKQAKDKHLEQIKSIRIDIMNAERAGNIEKIASLMKEAAKLERKSNFKATSKLHKDTKDVTKKQRDKTVQQLLNLEVKYVTDLNNIEYRRSYEALRYEEAKILHKIQSDHDGMVEDLANIKQNVNNIKTLIIEKNKLLKEVYNHSLTIKISELEILQQNEYLELDLILSFKELLNQIKIVEQKRNVVLKQTSNNHQVLKIEEDFKLKKAIEDIKLDQETNDIDKLILRKRNETLIKNEKQKEELNSEVIYQESLIKIAQKEHELQMIKVKSLYENERSLAEEQVERINLGVQVNDTFVKTTLQNQLLFASQQINCAESEFEIRVESVNLTHDQEVQYANKKIEYYRQKYEYDKSKYRKELNDKLEDLNYKLLLFTDEKDNKEITTKIDALKSHYDGLIEEIELVEAQDKEIQRYEKVINDAENRANIAIKEAEALREQTSSSFQALYDATKAKFDLIEEENQTEDTRGIMPLLNNTAISSADERLQLAIKEADQLYNERIENPKKVIQETKEQMIQVTNSDETEKFIAEQKELKKLLLKTHREHVLALEEQKQIQLQPLFEEHKHLVEQLDDVNVKDTVFEDDYRKKDDINQDYSILIQKENDTFTVMFKQLEVNKKAQFGALDLLIKQSTKPIKQTLKPYKKYIRSASRSVTAKKKNLQKEFNKQLKKQINDAEKKAKEEIRI